MSENDGSGYQRVGIVPAENAELTHVGIGTPMGEMLRRYWHPVCLSVELDDLPKKIRILGEELVAFRDGSGRVGVMDLHCMHRGASLEYGRIEEDGLRCCYHGWKFDTEGHCLDQPGEPLGSDYKDKVRQAWYPAEERYGLVFAYMGPPDAKPMLPHYDTLEREGVELVAYRNYSRGVVAECNWLQLQENAIDPAHTYVLHAWNPGLFEFTDAFGVRPEFDYVTRDTSVSYVRTAELPNGNQFIRTSQIFVPTARAVPPTQVGGADPGSETERSRMVGWWVPVDDTHTIGFHSEIIDSSRKMFQPMEKPTPRSYEETQRTPDDWEAQTSQRPIAVHDLEHLGVSDRGIVIFRRKLQEAVDAVREGRDPPGIARQSTERMVEIASRNDVIPVGETTPAS